MSSSARSPLTTTPIPTTSWNPGPACGVNDTEAPRWACNRLVGASFGLSRIYVEQTVAELLTLRRNLHRIGGPAPAEQPGQHL